MSSDINVKNRTLFHGDNLPFLQGISSGAVHLIATDPPFKKGRDFHATPGSLAGGARFKDRWNWDDDVHDAWVDRIKDDWPAVWAAIESAKLSYGEDMAAFLCWLAVRLMEMHRILRPDGSLYLHIDHTAHAYVKCLMDAIFGWKNFRNEIVWRIGWVSGFKTQKRGWIRNHDTILYYVKSKAAQAKFNKEYIPYPPGYVRRDGKPPQGKGIPIEDTWNCSAGDVLDSIMIKSFSKEKTGYPTQKPLALYERIIKASSNEGDWVLDPFCGCATTPIAAERLKRRWIGMDIWDGALEQVQNRLARDTILRFDDQQHHVTLPKVHYETKAPIRTDDNEIAAPTLKLRIRRPAQAWEKISHKGMVNILAQAQRTIDGIICGGCGRVLEREFMELDHITPKKDRGANHILNRILLCRPCNRRKRENLTLSGLLRENKKVKWMRDEKLAKRAQNRATDKAEWARDHFHTEECQALIAGNSTDSAV